MRSAFESQYIRLASAVLVAAIPRDTKRLVVFLTPGYQRPGGGVLSIASLYEESAQLRQIHGAEVVLCTVPGDPRVLKYTWFKNDNYILQLEVVLKHCRSLEFLMLHIPEIAVNRVGTWLARVAPTLLRSVREMRLNVLLQNINFVQNQDVIGLRRFGTVTCTTAHEAYSNDVTRKSLGVPLHRMSVFISPEQYRHCGYEAKEPLLIVSPDAHPLKELVLHKISAALPGLRIQIIDGLSYEGYKQVIRRAKWSLTFGEGLDGYFAETIFSGGVSFAVFNDRFFTPEFSSLETVYASWDVLVERIAGDLQRLDEPLNYRACWRQEYDLLASIYEIGQYRENLRRFYQEEYTFP